MLHILKQQKTMCNVSMKIWARFMFFCGLLYLHVIVRTVFLCRLTAPRWIVWKMFCNKSSLVQRRKTVIIGIYLNQHARNTKISEYWWCATVSQLLCHSIVFHSGTLGVRGANSRCMRLHVFQVMPQFLCRALTFTTKKSAQLIALQNGEHMRGSGLAVTKMSGLDTLNI